MVQRSIDVIGEGLPHRMSPDLSGQLIDLDGVLQDSMILDPADRPAGMALPGPEDEVVSGQDRPLRQLIDPGGQRFLRLRMKRDRPGFGFPFSISAA